MCDSPQGTKKKQTQTCLQNANFKSSWIFLWSLFQEPLFLDLIGTCHSVVQQPIILKTEHVAVHRHQWNHTLNSPDSVRDLQGCHNTLLNQQELSTPTEEVKKPTDFLVIHVLITFNFFYVCAIIHESGRKQCYCYFYHTHWEMG